MKNLENNNPNKHIEDYLNFYFKLSKPDFAVLLTGEWGSGKTWFINEVTKNYSATQGKEKNDLFLFISLYGMTDISEIDQQIFEKLHPVISSKPVKYLGNIINGALKMGFKLNLDLNKDDNEESEIGINSESLSSVFNLFTIKTDKIIIIDDIERCFIKPQRLFGYINTFVEHQRANVVLISHEEELFEKKDEKNNKLENSKRFKEKTIGATFKVESCVNEAFNSFIDLIESKEKDVLNIHSDLILNVYNRLDYHNLRNLKQAIQNFPFFYKQFPEGLLDYKLENSLRYFMNEENKHYSYMESTIEMYFYLKLEGSQGLINNENWIEAKQIFNKTYNNYTKHQQIKSKNTNDDNDILFRSIIKHDLLGLYWYNAVIENKNYREILDEKFSEIKKVDSEKERPLWKMLNNIITMSEEEVKSNYENLKRDFEELKYTHPGEILHIAGLFILMSNHGIIPLKSDEIKSLVLEIIHLLTQKSIIKHYQNFYGLRDSYGSYIFSAKDDPVFKEIYELNEANNKIVSENSKILSLKKDLEQLPKNFTEFCNELRYINYNGKYSDFSALTYIENTDDFFTFLTDVQSFNLSTFLSFLMERYEIKYGNGIIRPIFKDEYIFLVKLKEFIESKILLKNRLYNISSFKFAQDIENLNLIITRFQETFIELTDNYEEKEKEYFNKR